MSVVVRWLPRAPDGWTYGVGDNGVWYGASGVGVAIDLRVCVGDGWQRRHGAVPPAQVLTG